MIQRPQTFFLFLAAAALIGFLVAYGFLSNGVAPRPSNLWQPIVAGVFCGMAAVVSLVAVFMYRNRSQQRRLVAFAQWMVVLGYAAMIVGMVLAEGWEILLFALAAGGMNMEYFLTLVLPPVGYLFLWLSRKRIEKDIERVHSMDRLR